LTSKFGNIGGMHRFGMVVHEEIVTEGVQT
jgi:hypothetical protein